MWFDEKEKYDAINPEYYRNSEMECIDAIEGLGLPFHEAQILKYIYRWRNKGGVTDLKKALWYLHRLINKADEENENYNQCYSGLKKQR